MQETRHKVEEEKAELQSLVSDISHQTKTPIANLKMLNDTMLTRKISEETREEFLHATASQLDKLDFLIQGMVKTSRLETGVITLEKKETAIADTLVDAINGVLAVSYTHLFLFSTATVVHSVNTKNMAAVQMYEKCNYTIQWEADLEKFPEISRNNPLTPQLKEKILAVDGAVSYTHLDVYKRQQYSRFLPQKALFLKG